jgi:hypothetical protein
MLDPETFICAVTGEERKGLRCILRGAAAMLEHAAMRLRIHGDPQSAGVVAGYAKIARAALANTKYLSQD